MYIVSQERKNHEANPTQNRDLGTELDEAVMATLGKDGKRRKREKEREKGGERPRERVEAKEKRKTWRGPEKGKCEVSSGARAGPFNQASHGRPYIPRTYPYLQAYQVHTDLPT
jgi:hypothetical protein